MSAQRRIRAVAIPPTVTFTDLALSRGPDGRIHYETTALEIVATANGLDLEQLAEPGAFSQLLTLWYLHHRSEGGDPDPVMESLIAESEVSRDHGAAAAQPGTARLH